MTTTRKPTNCTDCNKSLRSNRSDNDDLCVRCYDLAALENDHQDGHHEDEAVADCLMCDPNARTQHTAKAGHTNGKPLSHTSHAGHDHPATKAARAACRKAAKA
jgi:hypothetical protein